LSVHGKFFNNLPPYIHLRMPDNILFSSNATQDLNKFLQQKAYSQLMVLVDNNTHQHCYPLIEQSIPAHDLIKINSGEEYKTLETCQTIWQKMTDKNLDRHAALIILGGGVLGDMGGFCAATYKRGIDFILIPTTLLSQVDSSIGGKLGVDFNHYKNHIGVFQLPALTLLYAGFLKTLPPTEMRSGYAEIIKHILTSDLSLWEGIRKKTFTEQNWDLLMRHSVEFKARVVLEDPKEKGLRKILNAGHTIGHAIETYMLNINQKVMHGEAVAAGLIAEGFIAEKRNLLSKDALNEIIQYIISIYGKINYNITDEAGIAQLTLQDKKNKGNKVLCVLLDGIGKARWDCEISVDEIKEALSFYRSLQM
jgi:3-dehydroquinate synthase